jgi:hypothetical protein
MISPNMTLAEFLGTVTTDMADRESRFADFTCTNENLRLTFGVVLMDKEILEPAVAESS